MSTKLRIALSAALVLGTASAALAANKHPIRHTERTVQSNAVAPSGHAYPGYNAYGAYGSYPGHAAYGRVEPYRGRDAYDYNNSASRGETYIYIQDKDFRDSQ